MAKIMSSLISKPSGVVAASTIGVAVGITSTVTTVFSLFLVPIATEFDTPRSSVSIVLILIAIANAVTFPIIGRLADRYGARIIVLPGLLLFVASIALVSLVEGLFQLYVIYTLIGVTGSVLGPILFTKIIAGWFDKNRGFFLGVIGGVGNGVGSALMPVYVFMLISDYGWRVAYQGIAIFILIVGFPVLFFLLRDPPKRKISSQNKHVKALPGLTFNEAKETATFWLMLLSISLYSGCLLAAFIHVIPMLTDRGITMYDATAVLATFALMTVVSQVAIGGLLDKINKPQLISPFFVMAVLGLGIFASVSSFPLLMLSGVLMGVGLGAEFGLLPYCISRYFGLKDYGSISGFMYAVVAITTGFMPVLMDVIFDVSGSYDIAIIIISIGMLMGAAIISKLPTFDALTRSLAKSMTAKGDGKDRGPLLES